MLLIRAAISLLILTSTGVPRAQSTASPHEEDQEFTALGVSCGQGRTKLDYRARDGSMLYLSQWRLPSPELFAKIIGLELGPGWEVIERRLVLDEYGKVVGRRVIARYRGGIAVAEGRGRRLLIIEAGALELAMEFERYLRKNGEWHSGAGQERLAPDADQIESHG